MPNVVVGTSGWAYSSWKPEFYPREVSNKKFLTYYSSHLNGVEVNYTFRHLLSEKTQQTWIEQTPESFRFAIKAHQRITHFQRLRNTDNFVQDFVNTLMPLANAKKLGPVLFQLPPQLKCDLDLLKGFIGKLPTKLLCTFEFRHASWFVEEVYSVLRSANIALCWAETEDLTTPQIVTADFCYFRLRKPGYTQAKVREIRKKIGTEINAGRDVFAFFKHEEAPEGALQAREVLSQLAKAKK